MKNIIASALLLAASAVSASGQDLTANPEPQSPAATVRHPHMTPPLPTGNTWTLLMNVYGYKSGGPVDMPNLNRESCTKIMEQVNAKDVRVLRRILGDDDGLCGMKALACINGATGEIIWP